MELERSKKIRAVEAIHRTSHGNSLRIEFEYPETNPENYVANITNAMIYANIFNGVNIPNKNDA